MREIRQSGSEGGATSTIVPTPILGLRPCSIFIVILNKLGTGQISRRLSGRRAQGTLPMDHGFRLGKSVLVGHVDQL